MGHSFTRCENARPSSDIRDLYLHVTSALLPACQLPGTRPLGLQPQPHSFFSLSGCVRGAACGSVCVTLPQVIHLFHDARLPSICTFLPSADFGLARVPRGVPSPVTEKLPRLGDLAETVVPREDVRVVVFLVCVQCLVLVSGFRVFRVELFNCTFGAVFLHPVTQRGESSVIRTVHTKFTEFVCFVLIKFYSILRIVHFYLSMQWRHLPFFLKFSSRWVGHRHDLDFLITIFSKLT